MKASRTTPTITPRTLPLPVNRAPTWFAIGYQCGFAYLCALMVNQFGGAFTGNLNVLGLIVAIALLVLIVYMLVKPYKEADKLSAKL